MDRKILLYWLAQLGGWGAYYVFSILLLLSTTEFTSTLNLFLWVVICIAFSILLSHGLRFVILKLDLLGRKLHELLLYTIAFAIVCAFALEWFQYFLDNTINLDFLVEPDDQPFSWAIFFLATSRSLILFLLWSGFYYVFVIIEKSRKQELLNLQWMASKNEIELKNLRAQLNPHFLFNSLNSIRALVGLNPDQAKVAITQLSNLLRNSINLGKQKLIPLKDEIELVEHYLRLEQIRFEERLKVSIKIDDSAKQCQIPPLMVQTIVENAIKHGISKSIEGGSINIIGNYLNNELVLVIENSGKLEGPINKSGVGISNTEKRLAILFEENSSFELIEEGEYVKATIKIKYP